jgi:hypothetical protein
VFAVPVPRQVEGDHPEVLAESGSHMRPPMGMGTSAVDKNESTCTWHPTRQGMDCTAVDSDFNVSLRDGQRT